MTNEERNARRRELRLEKKLSTLRKDCIDKILEVLKDSGYTVSGLKRLSGYFIFEFGGNSVNTSRINEIPGWKFGIWLTILDQSDSVSVEFFAQFENDIDKFKPERSVFLESFNIPFEKGFRIPEYFNNELLKDKMESKVLRMLKYIKSHPYRAWATSYYDLTDKYQIPWSGFKCWKKYWTHLIRYRVEKWYQDKADYRLLRFLKKNVLYILNDWGITKSENISPAYEVYAPYESNKKLFGRHGIYSIFCDEETCKEILENETIENKYKKYARNCQKLSKKFKALEYRYYHIARLFHLHYFSEVCDCVFIVTKKGCEHYKTREISI